MSDSVCQRNFQTNHHHQKLDNNDVHGRESKSTCNNNKRESQRIYSVRNFSSMNQAIQTDKAHQDEGNKSAQLYHRDYDSHKYHANDISHVSKNLEDHLNCQKIAGMEPTPFHPDSHLILQTNGNIKDDGNSKYDRGCYHVNINSSKPAANESNPLRIDNASDGISSCDRTCFVDVKRYNLKPSAKETGIVINICGNGISNCESTCVGKRQQQETTLDDKYASTGNKLQLQLETLELAMTYTQESQQMLLDWDRNMGLKRDHSKTVNETSSSRKKARLLQAKVKSIFRAKAA